MKMTTAKQTYAMYADALMSGCLDCSTLTVSNPPMMNMNAVSGDTEFIIGAIKCYQLLANQTES